MHRPLLFLDENISYRYADIVRGVYKEIVIRSHRDENLSSTEDVPLFDALGKLGYVGIVTLDQHQLVNHEERAALRASGLNWIGLTQPPGRGVSIHSRMISALLFGLPQVAAHITASPHIYRLPMGPRQGLGKLTFEPL